MFTSPTSPGEGERERERFSHTHTHPSDGEVLYTRQGTSVCVCDVMQMKCGSDKSWLCLAHLRDFSSIFFHL